MFLIGNKVEKCSDIIKDNIGKKIGDYGGE